MAKYKSCFQDIRLTNDSLEGFNMDRFMEETIKQFPQTVFAMICPFNITPDIYGYHIGLFDTPEGQGLCSFKNGRDNVAFLKEVKRVNPHLNFTDMYPLNLEDHFGLMMKYGYRDNQLGLIEFNCFPKPTKQKTLDNDTTYSNTGTNEGA